MKSIAVLMTVHNRREKTIFSLNTIYNQILSSDYSIDVFLTDDGCTDGTRESVSELFPTVYIINGDGTLFWNRGMYAAWKAAIEKKEYDYYVWLNDDTFLYADSLEYLLTSCVNKGNNCIIAGATCSKYDPTVTTYSGFNYNKMLDVNGKFQKVRKFNGNFVLIPKSVFDILGMNDPYYRHSFGDIDYGLRANQKGICCYITDKFIGTCEQHEHKIKCFDVSYTLKERLHHFYSPLGMNPFEFFHMNIKTEGLLKSISVFITTHLRVFFPKLWR